MASDTPVWFISGCSTGSVANSPSSCSRAVGGLSLPRGMRGGWPIWRTVPTIVALAVSLDVTDQAQIDEAVAQAQAKFGRIDVLVNNAGLWLSGVDRGGRGVESVRSSMRTCSGCLR